MTKRQLWWYPELAIVEDERVRREVLKRAVRAPWSLVKAGVVGGCVGVAGPLVAHAAGRFVSTDVSFLVGFSAQFVCAVAVGFALAFWLRTSVRRAIRRELLVRGYAVCLKCGYDMRGLPENRCPECGTVAEPVAAGERREGKV